jgi:hypothetical protein
MGGRFVEGLYKVGVLQLKYKYPFICSFTCCVFVHAIWMSISYICCYIYGFSCDYCIYCFTIIFELICVVAEYVVFYIYIFMHMIIIISMWYHGQLVGGWVC